MCTGHNEGICPEEMARLVSRRGFLRTTAATTAAVGAAGAIATPALAHGRGHSPRGRVPVDQISVQLFTLRDILAQDFEGTLAALGGIGYKRVEHAGFVGRTAAQFKAALDRHGLWASSGHVLIPQPFNATTWAASLADARTLRSRYIVHPFFGIDFGTGEVNRSAADWRAFARDLNRAGRQAKAAGLQLGYHNHNWEFFPLDDAPSLTAFEVLAEETDPRYVHLEVDLFWAWRGANDPVDIIKANKGRVRQYHVKDLNQGGSFADPGEGLIDFPRIFAHSREAGAVEYIVERDDAGTAPRQAADAITTAEVGFEYLRTVRF